MGNEILIGEKLRQARLKKNISIDELQKKTKIQKRYLEAIEKGAFEELPGAYYVRTFLRQYAQEVDLDGDFLIDVYEGNDSFEVLAQRPHPKSVEGSRKALHEKSPHVKKTKDYLPVILLGLIAVMIIGIIVYITWQENNTDPIIGQTASSVTVESAVDASTEQSSVQKKEETEQEENKDMTIKVDNSNNTQPSITLKQASDPVQLELRATDGRCWIGVTVDGSSVFEQTLAAGQTEKVSLPKSSEQATVVLGDSRYVSLKANDQAVDFQEQDDGILQKTLIFNISY
ncbi:MAG TPA: RodZ domain-containing protein [Tetragenococcus sp.]|nr:RodZ domain-containing protein [Tetragenococcus sp.]